MLATIFQYFLLIAAGIFLLGVLAEKGREEKNQFFSIAVVLIIVLLISLKIV